MKKTFVFTGLAMLSTGVFAQQNKGKDGFLLNQAYAEMQRVAQQVDLVQNSQDDLAKRLSSAERTNSALRDEISALRADIDSLRSDLSAARNLVSSLQQDVVTVKSRVESRPVAVPTVGGAYKDYVVQSGDTLYVVAQASGTTVKKIKEANGLKSDTLRVGQTLKIPVEK